MEIREMVSVIINLDIHVFVKSDILLFFLFFVHLRFTNRTSVIEKKVSSLYSLIKGFIFVIYTCNCLLLLCFVVLERLIVWWSNRK